LSSSVPSTSMPIRRITRPTGGWRRQRRGRRGRSPLWADSTHKTAQNLACEEAGANQPSYDKKVMDLGQFAGVNAAYVLELYERYRQNPESVDPDTRKAFETWTPEAQAHPSAAPAGIDTRIVVAAANLVESIRRYGHLAAQLDPLGSAPVGDPSLSPRAHGITDDDLKRLPASLVGGPVAEASASAYDAIQKLRRIYCSTTGFDYAQVFVPEEREWLRHAAESGRFLPPM